jgi:foldase protein PrsA
MARRRLVLILGLLALLVVPAACGERRDEDPVVAKVNGQPITAAQVRTAVGLARVQGDQLSDAQGRDALVDQKLIEREATRLGVGVDEAVVDDRIKASEDAVGGAAMLDKLLADQGVTREQFRDHARSIVLAEAVRDASYGDVRAGAGAARRYFDRHEADFSIPETVDLAVIQAKTRGPIRAARQEIRQGDTFAEAAHRHTTDEVARENGGAQGWIVAGSLPGPLGDAVDKLRPGQVSGPVEGPGGWYLLTIYGRRPAKDYTFAEVKTDIIDQLTRERRDAALARWLEGQRASAAVEIP